MSDVIDTTLPPSLQDARVSAYLQLLDRLDEVELENLLMYRLASTPAAALPYLARQFGLASADGWDLAVSDDDKRALIINAIALQRTRGTPGAVRKALLRLGFPSATINDRDLAYRYDGTYRYNGACRYSGAPSWAVFGVDIDVGDTEPAVMPSAAQLRAYIDQWKPARSHLGTLSLRPALDPPVEADDPLELQRFDIDYWDGGHLFDGSRYYDWNITEDVTL